MTSHGAQLSGSRVNCVSNLAKKFPCSVTLLEEVLVEHHLAGGIGGPLSARRLTGVPLKRGRDSGVTSMVREVSR